MRSELLKRTIPIWWWERIAIVHSRADKLSPFTISRRRNNRICRILETSVLTTEIQQDVAGSTLTMLCDNDLGHAT